MFVHTTGTVSTDSFVEVLLLNYAFIFICCKQIIMVYQAKINLY